MAQQTPTKPGSDRKHVSSPMELHGVDISSLDARDVYLGMAAADPNPLPLSPEPPRSLGADSDGRSFTPGHSPSLSAGRVTDDGTVSHFDHPPETRSRSLSTWNPYRKGNGSSPALSIRAKDSDDGASAPIPVVPSLDHPLSFPIASSVPASAYSASNTFPSATNSKAKGNKKRLPQVLGRSKSLRAEDQLNNLTDPKVTPKPANPRLFSHGANPKSGSAPDMAIRNLQPEKERKFMSIMRDRSQDRTEPDATRPKVKTNKSSDRIQTMSASNKANNTSAFFTDVRQSSHRATDGITKAGKGFFNKFTRNGSNHGKTNNTGPVEDYVPKILTLPLVEQTRRTRIAQSYDHCKDKTEFWMPALPWRCIDYLNGKCEEEGLYRVSGGLTKVKEWRKRFDTERDINLLDETELYDASIIASLFKEWIRELPDDVFPKADQARVLSQLPPEGRDMAEVTEVLRRELQKLAPFNYYLLFAITCHLSLLLEYEPKNKMTLDNLYRCFNQSLKLEGRLFYALVGNWRQCWAGCLTENDYLKSEYEYLKHPYPHYLEGGHGNGSERPKSSSDGGAASRVPEVQRPATSHTLLSPANDEDDENWITPVKKNKRSSSDVTGMSPMRFNASPLHRE